MSGSEERWQDEATGVVLSQCYYCAHRRPVQVCDAYPDGIPDAILRNELDHRSPLAGDHGVLFRPRTDATPEELARLARVLDALKGGDDGG